MFEEKVSVDNTQGVHPCQRFSHPYRETQGSIGRGCRLNQRQGPGDLGDQKEGSPPMGTIGDPARRWKSIKGRHFQV